MQPAVLALSSILAFLINCVPSSAGGSSFLQAFGVAQNLWLEKELSLSGNKFLTRDEVMRALPVNESVWWWSMNSSTVEMELKKNPLVKSASVTRSCMWGCFSVEIQEKNPRYVAFVQSQAWIVSDDGGFLKPIPNVVSDDSLRAFLERRKSDLIFVREGVAPTMSPDNVRGRLLYLSDSLPVIESEVGRRIREVSMKGSGEMEILFRDLPLRATFDFAGEDLSVLGKEARRLSLLLAQFREREHNIESIDLAFNKLAVVKLNSQQ